MGTATLRFHQQRPYFHRYPEICVNRLGSAGRRPIAGKAAAEMVPAGPTCDVACVMQASFDVARTYNPTLANAQALQRVVIIVVAFRPWRSLPL